MLWQFDQVATDNSEQWISEIGKKRVQKSRKKTWGRVKAAYVLPRSYFGGVAFW